MDITSIELLDRETQIDRMPNGIKVFLPSNWIIPGENRLSYTTIIRLIECCREYHWVKDIASKWPHLDSICADLSATFIKPISPLQHVCFIYKIVDVGKKSYTLSFDVKNEADEVCAFVRIVSVFYDSNTQKSVPIPDYVNLNQL